VKLSEAIRLGSIATTKFTGQLYNTERTSACALGAAGIAAGLGKPDFDYDDLGKIWPILYVTMICPACNGHKLFDHTQDLKSAIWHMNDVDSGKLFSRQEIADWVETVEKDQEEKEIKQNELSCSNTNIGAIV